MVISVLHLHSGGDVTQNSKKRRDFTLIAMELLLEVKIWMENVLLGQNLTESLEGGSSESPSWFFHFEQVRDAAQSKTQFTTSERGQA